VNPQPHYPFAFWRGDALEILAGVKAGDFDAIHASPPCQAFSALRVMKNAKPHADLLTPTRAALRKTDTPFVIENVPGAPMRRDVVLCGSMFGLGLRDGSAQLRRHRYFELNWSLSSLVPPCSHDARKPVEVYGHGNSGTVYRKLRTVTVAGKPGGSSTRDRIRAHNGADREQAMGIDWMGCRDELSQAIPPAYTEFIGRQLLRHIRRAA
jgi:DNA (cytosine-5)-methyltransferase 1